MSRSTFVVISMVNGFRNSRLLRSRPPGVGFYERRAGQTRLGKRLTTIAKCIRLEWNSAITRVCISCRSEPNSRCKPHSLTRPNLRITEADCAMGYHSEFLGSRVHCNHDKNGIRGYSDHFRRGSAARPPGNTRTRSTPESFAELITFQEHFKKRLGGPIRAWK